MRFIRSKNPESSSPRTPVRAWIGQALLLAAGLLGATSCEKDQEQNQEEPADTRQSLENEAKDRKLRIKAHCDTICSDKFKGCEALRFEVSEDKCHEACSEGFKSWFEELVFHNLIVKYEDVLHCATKQNCKDATKVLDEGVLPEQAIQGTPCDAELKVFNTSALNSLDGDKPVVTINGERWAQVHGVVHIQENRTWKVTLTDDASVSCSTDLKSLKQVLYTTFPNTDGTSRDTVEVEIPSDDGVSHSFYASGVLSARNEKMHLMLRGPVGARETYIYGSLDLIDCTKTESASR